MQCILRIIDGPSIGESIVVAPGEKVSVGRNDRAAGIAVPGDVMMSRLHFCVFWEGETCLVRDEGSLHGTLLNGGRVTQSAIKRRDVIVAGNSTFEVDFQVDPKSSVAIDSSTAVGTLPQPETVANDSESGFQSPKAAEIVAKYALEGDAFRDLNESASCEELIGQLAAANQLSDAIQFAAYALPKRSAVVWACQSVRIGMGDQLTPDDAAALKAAQEWARRPDDARRRAAMSAADKIGHRTAASWAAVAAFWSGGSMAPPAAPIVPPAENLTGKAVFGAVQLAAVGIEPQKAPDKQKQFIEIALAIARGEFDWGPPQKA